MLWRSGRIDQFDKMPKKEQKYLYAKLAYNRAEGALSSDGALPKLFSYDSVNIYISWSDLRSCRDWPKCEI